ncbi:MAG: YajQ family cyclic di-GMP-binding protein [Planctomycetota bacterium]
MPSFDVVSKVDFQEVDNAINIARKIILTRFDFRNSKTAITLDKTEKKIHVLTEDDMKLRAVKETLIGSFARRKVDTRALDFKEPEPTSQGMLKMDVSLKEGIEKDTAHAIVKLIKAMGLKVQPAIQDVQVRVSGKKIDDLQAVIAMLRAQNLEIPLQFVNMLP